MKYPSKLLLVLCLLALGSTAPALRAEDGESPDRKKEHGPKGNPGEMMKERLGLTDAQVEQMKAHREETEAKMKALKENTSMSPEEKKAAFMKLQEAAKAKAGTILNAEQMAKFEKMREEMKKKHPGGPGGPGEKGEKGEKGGKGEKGEKHGKPGVQ